MKMNIKNVICTFGLLFFAILPVRGMEEKKEEQKIEQEKTCMMCLENESDSRSEPWTQIACKHNFHMKCIIDLGTKSEKEVSNKCPICRTSYTLPQILKTNFDYDTRYLLMERNLLSTETYKEKSTVLYRQAKNNILNFPFKMTAIGGGIGCLQAGMLVTGSGVFHYWADKFLPSPLSKTFGGPLVSLLSIVLSLCPSRFDKGILRIILPRFAFVFAYHYFMHKESMQLLFKKMIKMLKK